MRTLWDDNLNKHVDVPEYKMLITLDIPDEVVSDDNISDRIYHDVRMRTITLNYLTKEMRDEEYESIMRWFRKEDVTHLMELQGRAIVVSHIVMIEKVDG